MAKKINILAIAWLVLAALLIYSTTLTVDINLQMLVAVFTLSTLIVLRWLYYKKQANTRLNDILRLIIVTIGIYLTFRYFFWRTFETLSYHDPFSFVAALALYFAEVYGIIMYILGIFVNINPIKRKPCPLPDNLNDYPSVDILIPTYDEDLPLLEITLLASTQIDYPAEKLRIYLLDDGGTESKRQHKDAVLAQAAIDRHSKLQALCAQLNVNYLTRRDNEHAKAGNINNALKHISGDLILMLDADHVPTRDILKQTAGFFLRTSDLFLVQTPHFFISPDPIEKNLQTFQRSPSENEMFYSSIQPGLDFWGSSFFCGSAALLRRSHLDEIGGLTTTSITEDADTALMLHSKGYKSIYVQKPLISGLQPATFSAFVRQRVRWAQGMVQIFLMRNPLRQKGLRFYQRLSYLNSILFWFFGYARLIFLLAPVAYLVFGLKIYDANLIEVLSFAIPHVIGTFLIGDTLFGKVRWTLISELYEVMQSLFSVIGINKVLRNPKSPEFLVTPKNEKLESAVISELAKPFYLLFVMTLIAISAGILRYIYFPEDTDVITITLIWAIYNFFIILGALGALLERQQRRINPRVNINTNATLSLGDDEIIHCLVANLSMGGAKLQVSADFINKLKNAGDAQLNIYDPALKRSCAFKIKTQSTWPYTKNDTQQVSLSVYFSEINQQKRGELVSLLFGDSERWVQYQEKREIRVGVTRGIWFLTHKGFVHTIEHMKFIFHVWVVTVMAAIKAIKTIPQFIVARSHRILTRALSFIY
ncbi:MAG: UDP-forming cellulose synthase catalytic subunit [Gammaproteobacteria bacterium]|nr:UDP-forming cellulose synthase catalytic subunit [Gammaproteobacteria bacterium]